VGGEPDADVGQRRDRSGAEADVKKALAVLACFAALVPIAASAAGKTCDARFEFRWAPQDANAPSTGRVDVVDTRSGRTVQVLDGLQNYQGDDNGLSAQDLNNDGCADLIVTVEVAGIGNTSSAVYLYDPVRRRFAFDEALSAIGNLARDSRDPNCVTGDWKGGAEDVGGERYCWRKGKLVKTHEYSVRPLYDRETGEFSCYEHVDTTYVDGRKRVRRNCTKTF
jgi:hypothetical protein